MKRKPLHLEDGPTRKVRKAAARVNREAYTFKPDVLISLAIDPLNQRILVKEVDTREHTPKLLEEFLQQIAYAARLYCTKERIERKLFLGRGCEHPHWTIENRRYVVGATRSGVVYSHARFCTRCGEMLEATTEEIER